MREAEIGSVPFVEAIDFFNQKNKVPTKTYRDMVGAAHAKSFTVAGATNLDVLNDLHKAVGDAITNGTTITDFRKAFDKTVQANGWSYKGSRGWRTRVIYDTNMRTAAMAGKWQQMQRVKEKRPYLQYFTVGDARVRPLHRAWDTIVLPIDSDFWNTHLPPNGWRCRCTVRSLSKNQLEREKVVINKAPKINYTNRIDKKTGEFLDTAPEGIDYGWDYNVGKSWLGADIAFGEKIMQSKLGGSVAKASSTQMADFLSDNFLSFYEEILTSKSAINRTVNVGMMSAESLAFLKTQKGNHVSSTMIAASDIDVALMPKNIVRNLHKAISNPKAIVFDAKDNRLLYVNNLKDGKASVFKTDSLADKINGFAKITEHEFIDVSALNNFRLIQGSLT